MEKKCKWYFDKSGQALTGPNDSIHETFKSNPYFSIVRESIQNSLDAVLDNKKPVRVEFSFEKLEKNLYPNLFDIKRHIIACWRTHKDDIQAEKLYKPMSNYLDSSFFIETLKISDFNTKGMDYNPKDYNSGFTSFVRTEGKSSKSDSGSGGSFGFGKGAYFVLSNIRTLLVSTMTDTRKVFFEGKTRLATHIFEGEIYTRDGFFNKDYSKPVDQIEDIPTAFIRSEPGTDIYIVGLIKLENRKTQMIKSVLNNFWYAIHGNKLVVKIDDIEINSDKLENIIDEYFEDEYEKGSKTNVEIWNPKPYYKAVKYSKVSDQYKVFSDNLETLGLVKFFVYLNQGLPGRISFVRKPRMVVFKETRKSKIQGYAGVFTCFDNKGNEILKEMENPLHNEWRKENYLDEDKSAHVYAKNAEIEIRNFINSTLEELSKSSSSNSISVMGLEEYLYIPEDLLEKDEIDIEGENTSNDSGKRSKEITELETGSITTEKNNFSTEKVIISPNKILKTESNVELTEEGDNLVTSSSREINEDDNGSITPGIGDRIEKGLIDDEKIKSRILIEVALRSFVQIIEGKIFHFLLFNSDRTIKNAELELYVGSDNDNKEKLDIIFSNMGEIDYNVIKGITLVPGQNILRICFDDNVKHSLIVKTYEIR